MISRIGFTEILVAFGVALLVFGPSKLPEIGKAFGKGIKEFKDASKDLAQSMSDADDNANKEDAEKQEA